MKKDSECKICMAYHKPPKILLEKCFNCEFYNAFINSINAFIDIFNKSSNTNNDKKKETE